MTYGNGFGNPQFLAGTPGLPRTCDNPKMVNMAYAPNSNIAYGYRFDFTVNGAHQSSPAIGCTFPGWSTFQFRATPLMGGRSWYLDPLAGITYSDNGQAGATSPQWQGN